MKTFWTVLLTSFVFGAVAGAQYPTNATGLTSAFTNSDVLRCTAFSY